MLNSKEKEMAKKEAEVYKQQLQLEIDQELFNKRVGNWETINKYREERREAQVKEAEQIGYMKGKQEGEVNTFKIKDQQIELLKNLLTEAIKALQIIHK